MLHLAQTNEVIVRVAAGDDIGTAFVGDAETGADAGPLTLDDVMDLRVKAERARRALQCSRAGRHRVVTRSPRCAPPTRSRRCRGRRRR